MPDEQGWFLPLPMCRALGLPHREASCPGDPRSGSSLVPCTADHSSARASVSLSVTIQNRTRWSPKSHPAEVPKARNSSSRPGPAVGEQPFRWAEWGSLEVLPLLPQGALFHLPQSLLLMTWLSPHREQRSFPWWPKALEGTEGAPTTLPRINGCQVNSLSPHEETLAQGGPAPAGLQLPYFGSLSSQHQWQPKLWGS